MIDNKNIDIILDWQLTTAHVAIQTTLREHAIHMHDLQSLIASARALDIAQITMDDMVPTGEMIADKLVFRPNKQNQKRPPLRPTYDVILCNLPQSDPAEVSGTDAIVCLESGRLIFREVYNVSKDGSCDLLDRWSNPRTITRGVRPQWVAKMSMGIDGDYWTTFAAHNNVRRIADYKH